VVSGDLFLGELQESRGVVGDCGRNEWRSAKSPMAAPAAIIIDGPT
jgi:hypothetical protein